MTESNSNRPTETELPYSLDYPPPDFVDPVIEFYKKAVDRTVIRENFKLTVEERLCKAQARAVERAHSLARIAELEEFSRFTRHLLESTDKPQSLEEYVQEWRTHQERQATVESIRQGMTEDESGLSQPLAEAFDAVRFQLGIKK